MFSASPNLVIDLRIHGTNQYQQVTLDPLVFQYVSGNLTILELKTKLTQAWGAVTDSFDRSQQLVSYRASIGAPKIIPCDSSFYNYTISDCDDSEDLFVVYNWTEPKSCVGGVELPRSFRVGRCNYVVLNTAVGIGVTLSSSFMIGVFLVLCVLLFLRRDEPIIRRSSWVFSIVIVLGGAMMNTFVISSVGPPDLGTCVVNIWLLSLGYCLLFGGFLTKMYRIERLLVRLALGPVCPCDADALAEHSHCRQGLNFV